MDRSRDVASGQDVFKCVSSKICSASRGWHPNRISNGVNPVALCMVVLCAKTAPLRGNNQFCVELSRRIECFRWQLMSLCHRSTAFDWGWYAEQKWCRTPSAFMMACVKCELNCGPLSVIISFGMPVIGMTWLMSIVTKLSAEQRLLQGMAHPNLLNESIHVKM